MIQSESFREFQNLALTSYHTLFYAISIEDLVSSASKYQKTNTENDKSDHETCDALRHDRCRYEDSVQAYS